MDEKLRLGIERIQETAGGAGLAGASRVRKRHVQIIRRPRMFVCDVASCAWLCKQFDPDNTILVIDEPTMGADQGNGRALGENSLTGLMVQATIRAPSNTGAISHPHSHPHSPPTFLLTFLLISPPTFPQAMIHAPYKTIWSSATLPAQAQLPTLVENFKRQFDVGNDNVRTRSPRCYAAPTPIPAPTSLLTSLPISLLRCTSSSRCSSTSASSS